MADTANSTRAPASGGPVTAAIRAMRGSRRERAIRDMLISREHEVLAPSALSSLSVGGLYSLFQAHDAASLAFTHGANTPCAGDDEASSKLLDEFADHHHRGQEAVIAEMEQRRPSDDSDRAMRFKLLAAWYAGSENWLAVARLAAEADAATRSDLQEA